MTTLTTGAPGPGARVARSAMVARSARRGEEGVALMLVLLFVVLLGAIVTEYAYETQVEAALAANVRADLDAYVAAKSAVAAGLGLLHADLVEQEVQVAAASAAQLPGSEYFDSLLDVWATERLVETLNEGVFQCEVADEYGKININALFSYDEEGVGGEEANPILEEALRYLFVDILQAEEDPTDALLDYLDSDDDTRPEGAESDFYSTSAASFGAKNGLMNSIEELLLVPGITPELFFDCNRDPEEGWDEEWDMELEGLRAPSLSDLLTVHGHPQGKINVNTARPEVLDAVLSALPGGNPEMVEDILAYQMAEPFDSLNDMADRNVFDKKRSKEARGILDVRSDVFRILGDGRAQDVMVRIEAYVARTPPEAVGAAGPDGEAMELLRILDWRVIR